MYICPQCGNEVIGKLEDHYRFYPECGQKASRKSVVTATSVNPRSLADPRTVYEAPLLLEATRQIAMLKEPDYRNQALTPRTIQDFLQWLGGMLPRAIPRVPHSPADNE